MAAPAWLLGRRRREPRALRLPRRKPPIDTQTITRLANRRGGIVRFLRDGNARVVPTLDNLGLPRTRFAVRLRQTRERVR
jgi:hypothetical protein